MVLAGNVIGIDIGGTHTRVGRFDSADTKSYVVIARYPTPQHYTVQLDRITDALQGVAIAGIGVAVGAQLHRDGLSVHTAPNLPEYVDKPLASDLVQRFGCPVRLAHDPALRDQDRSAYLTLSTGTGCAFRVRQGDVALVISIEFGHQILDGNTVQCLCGQMGCLETATGGRQIMLHQGRPPESITDADFWVHFSEKLALGLINLAQLTRVEAVAIGGGIATNRPDLIPRVQRCVDARIAGAVLRLAPAALGDDAPLIGAMLLTTQTDVIVH
jgi:glucokinase